MMFAVYEGVVMDAFAVVFRAEIAFHKNAILSYLRLEFISGVANDDQIHTAIRGAAFLGSVRGQGSVFSVTDG